MSDGDSLGAGGKGRLSVLDCGYLGTTHAACMAKLGFYVIAIDTDTAKVDALRAGRLPFHEPGLEKLLVEGIKSGRLVITSSYEEVAEFANVHFLRVGTPQSERSDAADLTSVWSALDSLLTYASRDCVIVGKSTVPVGTAARIADRCDTVAAARGAHIEVVWNPEFLREGFAVHDTLHPDRIVVGTRDPAAADVLRDVYAPMLDEGTPYLVTDFATAELTKTAANAFFATKISFINAFAELCEIVGGDVSTLATALGHDVRIGRRFLGAGLGFGGGCLPKDIRAVRQRAREISGSDVLEFLGQIDAINERCRQRAVEICRRMVGGTLDGRKVSVLGAAFKPDSDDVRDSPALEVAACLAKMGAHVRVTDTVAVEGARRKYPELEYTASFVEACRDADICVLATESKDYVAADPEVLGAVVARQRMLGLSQCARQGEVVRGWLDGRVPWTWKRRMNGARRAALRLP